MSNASSENATARVRVSLIAELASRGAPHSPRGGIAGSHVIFRLSLGFLMSLGVGAQGGRGGQEAIGQLSSQAGGWADVGAEGWAGGQGGRGAGRRKGWAGRQAGPRAAPKCRSRTV